MYAYAANNPVRYIDPDGRENTTDKNYEIPLSETQKANVNNSIKNIKTNLDTIIAACSNYLDSNNPDKIFDKTIKEAAKKWLGTDLSKEDTVKDFKSKITSLKEKLNDYIFVYRPNKDNYAAVSDADISDNIRRIKFGKYSASELKKPTRNGNDLLEGIIIHEASHFELGTDDIDILENGKKVKAYGTQKAGKLPDVQKITNADNWEYFYEKCFCHGL